MSEKTRATSFPRPPGAHAPFRDLGPSAPITSGRFRSFDGEELFYCVEGEGPALLFYYGLVCSSLHWTYQIEELSRHYRCIWFDYRGHLNSPMPHEIESLTLRNCAKDAMALLDHLGIDEVATLGHSMGVNVALHHWDLDRARVKGMVLANGTVTSPFGAIGYGAIEPAFRLLRKAHRRTPGLLEGIFRISKDNRILKSAVALGGFNPALIAWEDVQRYINTIASLDPEIFLQLMEDYGHVDQTKTLSEVNCPTLVLTGQKDSVTPPDRQLLMHQLIEGSRHEIIRHASHCPQLELPEQVTRVIADFLAEFGWIPKTAAAPEAATRSTESANPANPPRPLPLRRAGA